ncbi:hypothetical protein F4780DRAFT_627726 [Xylariomycetidae sp. FL0641]|nr:hypothetical protein F4780DRAFT_627726 [Xylariomycetidae sp. FL0641]
MASNQRDYDFIIVGAGASGCPIARALSRTKRRPRVLLLEAGGPNNDPSDLVHNNMYTQFLRKPAQNWDYKSAPLPHVNNRQVTLDRGKGLGGSTAINFTFWTRGPRDDWDEFARVTGDEAWRWENAERRYRELERYHHDFKPGSGVERYCDHGPDAYGTSGPLRITSQSANWKEALVETTDVWEKCGYRVNKDSSTGDIIGLQVVPLTGYDGARSTAADLLKDCPDTLHIRTGAVVHRIEFTNGKANGVRLADGTILGASQEVIMCAGAIETPKLLMQSGVGPAEQLRRFGIPIVHANEHVGRNLRDHFNILMHFAAREDASKCLHNAPFTGSAAMGFFKHQGALTSPEFRSLPEEERRRMTLPTVPTWEIAHQAGRIRPGLEAMGPTSELTLFALNSQGRGEISLQSTDAYAPPVVTPAFLEHPWDKRIAVESTRECLKVMNHPESTKSKDPNVGHLCPKSDSEEDILEFWRQNLFSTWHTTSTCKMGRSEDEDEACVDTDFRVFGVEGLRVADLSVLPFLPSVHTQTYAYQVGMIAAEKIIAAHALDRSDRDGPRGVTKGNGARASGQAGVSSKL